MVAPATYQTTIAFLGCSPNRDIHTTVYLRLLLYDSNDKTIYQVENLAYKKSALRSTLRAPEGGQGDGSRF
jgi:hypothetical protein